jgi:hypothetical protein
MSSYADQANDATEFKIPAALIAGAVALDLVLAVTRSGEKFTAGHVLIVTGIGTAINVAIGLVALAITARIAGISFGYLRTAVIKLLAIFMFPAAVAAFIQLGILAWLVSMVLYLGLLSWLFELEGWELWVCALVMWGTKVAAGILLIMALTS